MSFADRFEMKQTYECTRPVRKDPMHHQEKRERFQRRAREMQKQDTTERHHFGRRRVAPKPKASRAFLGLLLGRGRK